MSLEKSATEVLRDTSRTFYLSIVRLPPGIREAVMASYLSMRAIDEIEDHERLDKSTKIRLLDEIRRGFQRNLPLAPQQFSFALKEYRDDLPEVTNRLDEWANLPPGTIAPCIYDAVALMARRMAYWVERDWQIDTRRDLDRYTFSVAGAVGVLLSDLWAWYDGTLSRRRDAVGYGRGLQAVNILRNRLEDLNRGVDFFPDGWTDHVFWSYAKSNLARGDVYVNAFPPGPAREFCRGPQVLAYATLEALARGEAKVSRSIVLNLFGKTDHEDEVEPYAGQQPDKGEITTNAIQLVGEV
jgi:farnesyl-diphosphate farnesyltransferase